MAQKKRVIWAIDLNGSPLNQFGPKELEIYTDENDKVNISIDGEVITGEILEELKDNIQPRPEFISNANSAERLMTLLHEIYNNTSPSAEPCDETFVFDCASMELWKDMWESQDTELIMWLLGRYEGEEVDSQGLPITNVWQIDSNGYQFALQDDTTRQIIMDANIHGMVASNGINDRSSGHMYFEAGDQKIETGDTYFPFGIDCETDAETGDSRVICYSVFSAFSGTIRVVYNPNGVIKA